MKRLTESYEKYISRFPKELRGETKYRMDSGIVYERLGAYEDLDERLNAVYGEHDGLLGKMVEHLERHVGVDIPEPIFHSLLITDEDVDRWMEFNRLEKKGKLLKLPCKIGDMVWDNDWGRPCSFEVTGFSFGSMNEDYTEEDIIPDQVLVYYTNSSGSITGNFAVSEIGKTVFFTREEAEAALQKKKAKNQEGKQ